MPKLTLKFKVMLFLFGFLASAGVQSASASASGAATEKTFEERYPYYVDACGTTEYAPIDQPAGGSYGHALLYIKGACRDTSASYPKLRLCNDQDAKDAGVGISFDYFFENVAWTAVESREFFFYGGHPHDQPFDQATEDRIINEAADRGYFNGVKLTPDGEKDRKPGESYAHLVSRMTLGTEFAVALARPLYCARIPTVGGLGHPKQILVEKMIAHLNHLNEVALKEGAKYDYLSNNCTHLVHNTLASIGFWKAKETGWKAESTPSKFMHMANFAVPLNTVFDAARTGSGEHTSPYPARVQSDANLSKTLRETGWMPDQPGVLLEYIPMHAAQNKLFHTDMTPMLFHPVDEILGAANLERWEIETKRFFKYLKAKRHTSLTENLDFWQKRFEAITPFLDGGRGRTMELYREYVKEKSGEL